MDNNTVDAAISYTTRLPLIDRSGKSDEPTITIYMYRTERYGIIHMHASVTGILGSLKEARKVGGFFPACSFAFRVWVGQSDHQGLGEALPSEGLFAIIT